MKAVFDHSNDEASNIKTFWFRPLGHLDYVAGQYTELYLPHDHPDRRGEKHWFTLSSAPCHELVSITTKYAGDDQSSTFKKTLLGLEPRAGVQLAEAMGDFVLPKDTAIPLVFVAGGIGITPFHAMLEWMASQSDHRNLKFIYSVRNENEIIFQDTFERAGIHATIVVGEPSDAWGGERGRLSAEMILGLTHPTPETLIYMSGPEPLVEALEKDMHAQGIAKQQLVSDFFPGYLGV